MQRKLFLLMLISFAVLSCQDDNQQRIAEQKKEAKKRETIFNNINNAWNFSIPAMDNGAQGIANNWAEWRSFVNEINLKPKTSIGAFQRKAATLSKKVAELNNNIPIKFNLPQTRSRIAVLTTNIKMLDLYMHLNKIPDEKVIAILQHTNTEIKSLQAQMQKIVRKSQIPLEEGESEILRMKDTTRAIPNTPAPINPVPGG